MRPAFSTREEGLDVVLDDEHREIGVLDFLREESLMAPNGDVVECRPQSTRVSAFPGNTPFTFMTTRTKREVQVEFQFHSKWGLIGCAPIAFSHDRVCFSSISDVLGISRPTFASVVVGGWGQVRVLCFGGFK